MLISKLSWSICLINLEKLEKRIVYSIGISNSCFIGVSEHLEQIGIAYKTKMKT